MGVLSFAKGAHQVLACSLLTVGLVQKSQASPPRCLIQEAPVTEIALLGGHDAVARHRPRPEAEVDPDVAAEATYGQCRRAQQESRPWIDASSTSRSCVRRSRRRPRAHHRGPERPIDRLALDQVTGRSAYPRRLRVRPAWTRAGTYRSARSAVRSSPSAARRSTVARSRAASVMRSTASWTCCASVR